MEETKIEKQQSDRWHPLVAYWIELNVIDRSVPMKMRLYRNEQEQGRRYEETEA